MEALKWGCADCGLRRAEDGRCENCGSSRVVLVNMAEELTGKKWEDAFTSETGDAP